MSTLCFTERLRFLNLTSTEEFTVEDRRLEQSVNSDRTFLL